MSNTDTNFPAVMEAEVGGTLIPTTSGRDLHAFLGVGRDFTTWMRQRVKEYGFVKGTDYVTIDSPNRGNQSGRGGDRRSLEYHLTLDMAKELSMVENNEQGRAVRRYFIECERRAKAAIPADVLELIRRTDGISRMLSHKVTEIEKAQKTMVADLAASLLPAVAQAMAASQSMIFRRGKTAGQIWRDHGFPRLKVTCWFSNRLLEVGCAIEGGGCGELGLTKARLFDPDKAELWLRNGGQLMVERKIAERKGSSVVPFRVVSSETGLPPSTSGDAAS